MDSSDEYTVTVVANLEGVPPEAWDAMAGGNPFVSHRFLSLLSITGCTAARTGWHPQFLLLHRGCELVGGAPSYLKTHSRGEFVFDQSWAQAFEQHGLAYYPKLVVAAPFMPVRGPRLLARDENARAVLVHAVGKLCAATETSSVHVLFVEEQDRQALVDAGFMIREDVQFHWRNVGYGSPADFLGRLSHAKRKKLKQDSRYVAEAGITFSWLEDDALTDEHLDFFYNCYANTYREHWSKPYLSLEFFKRAHAERVLHLVLMLASRDGRPVACALNVLGDATLYGRYWGSTEFVKGLHFETCYKQSIDYCIANGVSVFEGGAQGEHKMARGLMPTKTYSAHWVADRRFAAAIEDFLERETAAIDEYVEELGPASPFKR
jgi:predicted N-acyltransferase